LCACTLSLYDLFTCPADPTLSADLLVWACLHSLILGCGSLLAFAHGIITNIMHLSLCFITLILQLWMHIHEFDCHFSADHPTATHLPPSSASAYMCPARIIPHQPIFWRVRAMPASHSNFSKSPTFKRDLNMVFFFASNYNHACGLYHIPVYTNPIRILL